MRAGLYLRVSTEGQAANGVSLGVQEERLRSYCAAKDWEVAKVYRDEGASAKTLDRPALQALLADVKAKALDAVVVLKLDRLTRSVRDLGTLIETFERRGVALVSLGESIDASTAAGRLMLNVIGSVAQWERETVSERTKQAMSHMRQHLEVYGHEPYGYRRAGKTLEPVEEELKVVVRIQEMLAGGASLRKIVAALDADGVPTKNGGKWAPQTVAGILSNPIYQGIKAGWRYRTR